MFYIIHEDKPIYEIVFNQSDRQIKELFLIHSALDIVDVAMSKKRDYYLGFLRNEEIPIFAYINPNQIRFVLTLTGSSRRQIDKKTEGQVREFFNKVNEEFANILLNPLYKLNTPIVSKAFDEKIRTVASYYINTLLTDKRK